MNIEIEYQQIPIEKIIKYFVDGYDKKPWNYDWFYDPNKGIVVLRLSMEK